MCRPPMTDGDRQSVPAAPYYPNSSGSRRLPLPNDRKQFVVGRILASGALWFHRQLDARKFKKA